MIFFKRYKILPGNEKLFFTITIFIIPVLLNLSPLFAQEKEYKDIFEQLVEQISSESDQEIDYDILFEDLLYYYRNPLNLNTATIEELEKLRFINDFQIRELQNYIKYSGSMLSIYELKLLYNFSQKDIENILPFVTVNESKSNYNNNISRILKYGKSEVFLRTQFYVQQQEGYSPITDSLFLLKPNSRFAGNKMKYYTKYKYHSGDKLFFGITCEKDAGEEFFKGSRKDGFDFYSAHLQINNIGKIKKINLGDYQVQFGQGLVAGTILGAGKSSYVMDINRKYQGIKKYSSTDENRFMRGVGTSISLGNFTVTGFFSYKFIDGNINQTDSLMPEYKEVSSFIVGGYHRTPGENENRKTISETIAGTNVIWNYKNFRIGSTFLHYKYGAELVKNIKPYNMFEFQGSQNTNIGVDYKYYYRNFSFFGEEALSVNGGTAFLNGMIVKLAPQISLSVLHRDYSHDYQALYSGAFGESTKTANEKGLYFGTEIFPYKSLSLSGYFDTYSFDWLRYRINSPSQGQDFFVQTSYTINKSVNFYFRYKSETKFENISEDITGVKPVVPVNKNRFRFHINYILSDRFVLKSRIETASYIKTGNEPEHGFMMFQDIGYKPERLSVSFNFRFAVFDASYNSRIYAYENDILYAYSVPAYFGRGIRTCFTLKYSPVKDFIDIWLRYSQFKYADREVISSGINEIQGNKQSEIKFQIRIRF